MSTKRRYPYWFIAFVVLATTLGGLHQEAAAHGNNAIGESGRTLRPGDANTGCTAASGCHDNNQNASVQIFGLPAYLLPGGLAALLVSGTDFSGTVSPRMGVDVATKRNSGAADGTLSEASGSLINVSATEVVHCTQAASSCSPTPTLPNLPSSSGSYGVNFTMPAGAVPGETHSIYATARFGLGQTGGAWKHAATVTVTAGAVPAFTSAAPPAAGMVGVPYTHTFTASGVPAPTFLKLTGSFPNNVNLVNGVLSGTPTTTGTFTGTMRATNSLGNSTSQAFSITIAPAQAAPVITSPAPPGTGTKGVAYTHTYTASGNPTPTFSVTSGALPPNVTLNPTTGAVTGSPTAGGTFTGTVSAINGVLPNGTQNFTIVVAAPPAITSPLPPGTGTVGVAYNHTYAATGTPAPTFSVTAGALPNNVTLNPTTGAVTGSPTVGGTFTGTVTASNGVAPVATQNFSIVIAAPPAITSAAPQPTGTVGIPYNHTYTTTGNPAPTLSLTAGSLPTNLFFNTSTGVVSGSPSAVGTFTGTVTASNGVLPVATQNFSITIAAASAAPQITSALPPASGTVGVAYNHTYTAVGNPAPTFAVTAGALPTNVLLNPTTGVVSGSPSAVGTFTGTVTASNGVLPVATQNFSITIAAAGVAPVITSAAPPASGQVGLAYNHTFTATGNPAPTFAVTAGALPTNLLLNPNTGVVSGSPGAAGTFTGTVTASNGVLPNATQNFSITITSAVPTGLNHQGLWWVAEGKESGWGINFTHQGNVIFATWFTFGPDNQPQWYQIVASNTPEAPNVFSGLVKSTTGPPFNSEPFPPNANVRTTVGTATLTFAADGKSASFDYTVDGITQSKPIVPQELFPGQGLLPTCAFGTALADVPLATNYQSLWWATHGSDVGGDESGWGINFTHHGNVIFATWFTYDVNGKGWWLFSVASLTAVPGVYAGTVRVAAGPPFSAVPWDPNAVVRTTLGNATLTFVDGNHATFAYTVNGISQVKNLVRQLFDGVTATICH